MDTQSIQSESAPSTRQRDGAPLNDKLLASLAIHLNDDHRKIYLPAPKHQTIVTGQTMQRFSV